MPQKPPADKTNSPEEHKDNEESQPGVNETDTESEKNKAPLGPVVPGTPITASGLGEKLAEIKQSFQQTLSKVEKLTKEGEIFKQQIAELERADTDIKQVINTYTQFLLKSNKEKHDLKAFVETKRRMIDAAVGQQKAVVEKLITGREKRKLETAKQYMEATSQLEEKTQNVAKKRRSGSH